ncbi:uncharacterized protein LOC134061706 [Sardina pilchardus]|uniref:uncharacterized protein LOC134061706 n=1 Tax=Sardina pilchardus TaxID=27697 RepID=UPI002E1392C3
MSHPDTEREARPKRQVKLPAHFKGFEVGGFGPAGPAPPSSGVEVLERASRDPSPISQISQSSEMLRDEWRLTLEEMQQENEELREHLNQLPQLKSIWMGMKKENEEMRNHVRHVPDLMTMLQGLTQENAALKQEVQQLAVRSALPAQPVMQSHAVPIQHPQWPTRQYYPSYPTMPDPLPDHHQFPAAPVRQLTEQMRGLHFSDEPGNSASRGGIQTSRYHSNQGQYSQPGFQSSGPGYYQEESTFQTPHPGGGLQRQGGERESGLSGRSPPSYDNSGHSPPDAGHRPPHRWDTPSYDPASHQEKVYRGPKPSIPHLSSPDPRAFSRLRMALENLLPKDATELFKYQILCDHLKLEEAMLIADSYCNSRRPYTETMHALTRMYGQPHKLVLCHIAEVMDGPNISTGDEKNFRLFALRVRSLVSMLEQLGPEGRVELECGSHVSRLQSKLPHDLKTSFKRFIHPLRVAVPTLHEFSDWLEYELQVQEDSLKLSSSSRQESSAKKKDNRKETRHASKSTTILLSTEKGAVSEGSPEVSTNSTWQKGKSQSYCPYCDNGKHFLNGCPNFKELTKDQKESWIKQNNRCWRCGRNHHASKCTLKALCKTCNRKHLLILHEVNDRVREKDTDAKPTENTCLVSTTSEVLYVDPPMYSRKVLLKVIKVLLRNGNKAMEAYAVLDDGSERTIILHEAAQRLGLKRDPEDLILRTVRQEKQVLHGAAVSFIVSSVSEPQKEFTICGAFTAEQLSLSEHSYHTSALQQKYKHLVGLPLPQLTNAQPVLLIGSDCPHLITPIEPIRLGPPGGPAAVKTRLGWTLQGPAHELRRGLNQQHCLFTTTPSNADLFAHVERLWQMDVLPYRSEKTVTRSKQDQEAVQLLTEKTVRVEVDGVMRYATPLLRVRSMPCLHAPGESVLPQLRSTERRLAKNPDQAAAYQAEMERLLQAGYSEKLQPDAVDKSAESWYIPHHMVQHNGKNRIVYNCSFMYAGHNLNELLLPGPTLSSSLLSVLLRFREHSVALSSDIRGMFHQVRLLPEDKPLLRYLWRDMKVDHPPDVYQWQVLPFGTTCSPCCATYALQRHVLDSSQPGDKVRTVVEKSFYVDNCLHSQTSVAAAKELVDELSTLLATGGFELRQWASNEPAVISHLPSEARSTSCELWLSCGEQNVQESALGLHWNCQSDALHYKLRPIDCCTATMRNIYKVLASQYDPLGYIVPYTTRAKVLVQRLWDKKRDWDDPHLPEDLLQSWRSWEAELSSLGNIALPRCYTSVEMDQPTSKRDIHVFCDASEQAYGSVAYMRTENMNGQVEVAFLTARSRVAPKKQQTIPRLELCAALSGAQLSKLLSTELTVSIHSITLWSDSTTVLSWLLSSSCRYKVFVGTRVAEIQELTDAATWRYVRSADNPADDTDGGRLRRCSELEPDAVHPIILDPHHSLTKLIIKDYDEALLHPGTERVFAEVRRKYWVLRGREAVRRQQFKCTECRKWRARPAPPQMADLPVSRQRVFKPAFYSTGVDCFGPYLIKIGRRNEKRWGLLFKCMTTRAVHIDLLSSLDSDSFLMALRRFISRRGRPHEILCDQGTNFKGGERELQESFRALQAELQTQLASQKIRFLFNPPGAPHFGGCWEREIRSIKVALQVTIGAQTVTEEVLRTVLVEIEGILNSKPLGYTSSDAADPDPITPNCFIIGRRDASLPQVVYQDSEQLSRRRWRHSQLLADHFWRHFVKYYLPGLQARQKWRKDATDLQLQDVVMIVDPQLPRALWPVGKVSQVFPGVDGKVRSANVDVKGRTYTRPVARLVLLPALPDDS